MNSLPIKMTKPPDDNPLIEYAPKHGWGDFTEHTALSDDLWAGVSELDDKWHYMNPLNACSIWESCEDGTMFFIQYAQDATKIEIEQLLVQAGRAGAYVAPIIEKFGLVAVESNNGDHL